jgi:hypothetical protein
MEAPGGVEPPTCGLGNLHLRLTQQRTQGLSSDQTFLSWTQTLSIGILRSQLCSQGVAGRELTQRRHPMPRSSLCKRVS